MRCQSLKNAPNEFSILWRSLVEGGVVRAIAVFRLDLDGMTGDDRSTVARAAMQAIGVEAPCRRSKLPGLVRARRAHQRLRPCQIAHPAPRLTSSRAGLPRPSTSRVHLRGQAAAGCARCLGEQRPFFKALGSYAGERVTMRGVDHHPFSACRPCCAKILRISRSKTPLLAHRLNRLIDRSCAVAIARGAIAPTQTPS